MIDEEMLKKRIQLSREKVAYCEYRGNNSDLSEEEVRTLDKSRTRNVTIRNGSSQIKEKLDLNQESQVDFDHRDTLYSSGEPPVENMNRFSLNDSMQTGKTNSLLQFVQNANMEKRYKNADNQPQDYLLKDTQANENYSLLQNNQPNHQVTFPKVINSVDTSRIPQKPYPSNTQNFEYSVKNSVHDAPQNQLSRASHSAVNKNVDNSMNNNASNDNNYPNETRQTYPAHTGCYPYVLQINAYPSLPPYNIPQNKFINYSEVSVNNINNGQNPINENNQHPADNHFAVNYPNAVEPLNPIEPVHCGHYNQHPQLNFSQILHI
ncbi:hypothetical protein PV328_011038 [Microctonus aethiopoides]|uniref:Uncharacterized protein n=1 Tax=Microctonus aethiopoides TaxID=144406 RepID=A0AA39C4J2_9HYME|nr:hypothetical protein PV328_011038 [Microctonus aethiopoides]